LARRGARNRLTAALFGFLPRLLRAVMHTGCVAFGMDRLALALFATHGLEAASWPEAPRKALGL
jgi:hypothetical protein